MKGIAGRMRGFVSLRGNWGLIHKLRHINNSILFFFAILSNIFTKIHDNERVRNQISL